MYNLMKIEENFKFCISNYDSNDKKRFNEYKYKFIYISTEKEFL